MTLETVPLAAHFSAALPAALQPVVQPFKAALDTAFYDAFSFGVAQTFLLGVGASAVAFVISFAMKEIPLRTSFGPATAEAPAAGSDERSRRVLPAAD